LRATGLYFLPTKMAIGVLAFKIVYTEVE